MRLVILSSLVLALLALAGWSIAQQIRSLRRLGAESLSPEDRSHFRWQSYRRMVNAALMLLLAALLAGSYLSGLEQIAEEQLRDRAEPIGEGAMPPAEREQFLRFYLRYWGGVVLLVFGIVTLALADLWAIRLYAQRHLSRIQADRRVAIEEHLAYLKNRSHERNGKSH